MAIDRDTGAYPGTVVAGALPVTGAVPVTRSLPVTGSLSVGQLAARAGVRTDTIRYYERAGLLPEPNRTDGDHRRYGAADLDRMLFIRGARRLGLRLAEIRELVMVRDTGVCPCEPAQTLLREHVIEIDREIERLTALRAELSGMIAGLSGTSEACRDPVPGAWCAADCRDPEPDAEGGDRNVLMLR